MGEQVLVRVFWVIAVTQEKFEKMEETQEIELVNCAL